MSKRVIAPIVHFFLCICNSFKKNILVLALKGLGNLFCCPKEISVEWVYLPYFVHLSHCYHYQNTNIKSDISVFYTYNVAIITNIYCVFMNSEDLFCICVSKILFGAFNTLSSFPLLNQQHLILCQRAAAARRKAVVKLQRTHLTAMQGCHFITGDSKHSFNLVIHPLPQHYSGLTF